VINAGELLAGRYRLVSRVGTGAMGVVWKAHDERLHRVVAVKQLLAASMSDVEAEEANRRALREGRITARLHHPYAIAVYNVAEHDGTPYLIMEYLPSQSLSTVLAEQGPLPPAEVARIGSQIAAALVAAHEAGIVHSDIKPGNVLLAADGIAKITDFGISRAVGDGTGTATGILGGTPASWPRKSPGARRPDFRRMCFPSVPPSMPQSRGFRPSDSTTTPSPCSSGSATARSPHRGSPVRSPPCWLGYSSATCPTDPPCSRLKKRSPRLPRFPRAAQLPHPPYPRGRRRPLFAGSRSIRRSDAVPQNRRFPCHGCPGRQCPGPLGAGRGRHTATAPCGRHHLRGSLVARGRHHGDGHCVLHREQHRGFQSQFTKHNARHRPEPASTSAFAPSRKRHSARPTPGSDPRSQPSALLDTHLIA